LAGLLIPLGDVDRVFNETVVKELAALAGALPGADLQTFARDHLRNDARLFITARARLNNSQLRKAIGRLYTLTTRAHRGEQEAQQLARAVNGMHPDVRQWLDRSNATGRCIPNETEITSADRRAAAIGRLRLILSYGGDVKEGRQRSGGRRSKSYKPLLRQPVLSGRERRPRGQAERELVQNLALTYAVLTGEETPDTAHYDADIQGPFPRFACRCFELIGLPTGNVVRLINERGALRRQHALESVKILPVPCYRDK
jgi:hypothetical protein